MEYSNNLKLIAFCYWQHHIICYSESSSINDECNRNGNNESETTMQIHNHNGNHGNHNGNGNGNGNAQMYSQLITATTTTTRGIEYNRRQFNAYGNAIYTSNTATVAYSLNARALNGILYHISEVLNHALNCSGNSYYVVANRTQYAIHSLDILLSALHTYKSNDLTIYNAYHFIMEQRQRLQIQLQFMEYCKIDDVKIADEYNKISNAVKTHNSNVWLLRVWHSKKHKKEIATATRNVEKMQHGNAQRHTNNLQVLRGVMLSLYQYAR